VFGLLFGGRLNKVFLLAKAIKNALMEQLERALTILHRVAIPNQKPPTIEELFKRLKKDVDYKRTFHRDLDFLKSKFGIEIKGDRKSHSYTLAPGQEHVVAKLNELYLLFTFFSVKESISKPRFALEDYIVFDENPIVNNKDVLKLSKHCMEQECISVTIQNGFEQTFVYKVEPYQLVEFQRQWFLVCRYLGRKDFEYIALDQIENFSTIVGSFTRPIQKDLNDLHEYQIGIGAKTPIFESVSVWCDKNMSIELKENPWHHTQNEVQIENDGTVFRWHIAINKVLIEKLLSHVGHYKVLEPSSLKEVILEQCKNALVLHNEKKPK